MTMVPAKLQRALLRMFYPSFPVESQRSLSMANAALLKPEIVLSDENRRECVERLRLYKTPKSDYESANEAAVLVPLCIFKGELGFLYTLRSAKLNASRGQVSFPGGKRDKNDKDIRETALRETWEELAMPKERIDVWATGDVMGRGKVNVTPVLGCVGELDPSSLQINRDEVEEAFVVTLQNLCDPSLTRFTQFRNSYTLPIYLGGKYRVWGLTAAATHMMLRALVPGIYKHKLVHLPTIGQSDEEVKAATNLTLS